MLDTETMEALGELKTMAAKNGLDIDVDRMLKDMGYANRILTEMSNTLDQKQGLIVLYVMKQLCLYDASEGMSEG
ncbi:MAG: hypothetical protein HZB47_09520 [Nitrosomonadales bacterium]|nr:hypothetical protein [Nitrosomonadales bacterium]